MVRREHIIFAGLPGSGVSYIVNAIVGNAVFESGTKFGGDEAPTALTTKRVKCTTYSRAERLGDPRQLEKAAAEIATVLEKGTNVKLIFVIQLEAGRLLSPDVAVMAHILNTVRERHGDPSNRFSIIVNKCSPEEFELFKSRRNRKKLESVLWTLIPTGFVRFVPWLHDAEDTGQVQFNHQRSVLHGVVRNTPLLAHADAKHVRKHCNPRRCSLSSAQLASQQRARCADFRTKEVH